MPTAVQTPPQGVDYDAYVNLLKNEVKRLRGKENDQVIEKLAQLEMVRHAYDTGKDPKKLAMAILDMVKILEMEVSLGN